MSKTVDQSHSPFLHEFIGILLEHDSKLSQVPCQDSLGKLQVRVQSQPEVLIPKHMPLRNLPEQQLHHNKQLSSSLLEPYRCVLGSLPDGLVQVLEGFRVFQLGCLDLAQVEQVPCALVVVRVLREGGLTDELLCLLVQVVVYVVAQEQVQEHRLPFPVVPQGGGPQAPVEKCPNLVQPTWKDIGLCIIDVRLIH